MYKLARFIVKKRRFILLAMSALAVFFALLIPRVTINYDLVDYLDSESETAQALEIIDTQYDDDGTIFLMAESIEEDDAYDFAQSLENVEGVERVTFDAAETHHFQDSNAWYIVSLAHGDFAAEAEETIERIESLYGEDYALAFDGPAVNNYELTRAIDSEMPLIILLALGIVIIILTLAARSFVEPFIFLFVIGIAIVINMGSNYFLPDVSYVTQSIVAVLQLGLSMDYSIMLLNRYRQEKEKQSDSEEAMITALHASFAPISSSSLTTVAGMVALMFMSFGIGFDIGSVLAKGILISLISVFLLMPGLLVMLNGIYTRLGKTSLTPKGRALARVACNNKHMIPLVTIALVGAAFVVQQENQYFYTEEIQTKDMRLIEEKFGENRQLVLVYDEPEEDFVDKEREFIERVNALRLGGDDVLNFYTANANTVYDPITAEDAAQIEDIDPQITETLFGYYALTEGMQEDDAVKLDSLVEFLSEIETEIDEFELDEETQTLIDDIDDAIEMLNESMHYEEAAELLGVSEFEMQFIYFAKTTGYDDFDASTQEQLTALLAAVATGAFDPDEPKVLGDVLVYVDERIKQGQIDVDEEAAEMVDEFAFLYRSQDEGFTYSEFANTVDVNEEEAALLFALYLQNEGRIEDHVVETKMVFDFLDDKRHANSVLAEALSEDDHAMIDDAIEALEESENNFVGDSTRRMILTFTLPAEGDTTFTAIEAIRDIRDDVFGDDGAYFAGGIVSNYDIQESFSDDLFIINMITISAIFLLVALTFKSLAIPIILAMTIQGAIWVSMSVSVFIGEEIFFLSYLIVLAIQMGATVDYGILMTSNYLEYRHFFPKRESVRIAFFNALPTIFTSGLILFTAGLSVGIVSTQVSVYSVGYLLARGVVVSLVFVMIALPAMLYTFDGLIRRTTYKVRFYLPKSKG